MWLPSTSASVKIRSHKVVIMTDADVDGSHIRTLLLTFFFRQMAQVVERGYLYIAQPPLYRVQKGQKLHPELEVRLAKIERDEEHGCDSLVYQTTVAGATRETRLDFDYLSGPEWGELAALHAALAEIGPGPYRIEKPEGTEDVDDVFAAVETLKKSAAQGQNIQRYKGLGEMNPQQLWETTMDPERRTVLQVRVDDMVEADGVFSILMGDAVEPRREFIEKHALDVQNLDV